MSSVDSTIPRLRLPLVLLLVLLPAVGTMQAQEWNWPEHAKNLKVLPKDTGAQQLRSVMVGFTRSLGVRCVHCHVGKEGEPFSSWDFASDTNPNKDRARQMLRMLKDINDDLAKIQPSGDQRVNMWCHTCHQGRPRPMTLEEALGEAYRSGGIAAATSRYHDLKERYYGRGGYDFGVGSLNSFGYELLQKGNSDDAIAIFRLNASEHPEDGNVWDSLAEAYRQAGRPELAKIYYRKSLEIDPENRNALKMLGELESPASERE